MQQSISLLKVKDPLFKRMGASRLARFAIDGNFCYVYISIKKFLDKFIDIMLLTLLIFGNIVEAVFWCVSP